MPDLAHETAPAPAPPRALRRLDLRGRVLDRRELRTTLPRGAVDVDAALADVTPVVEAVRTRGADAVRELGQRFDGVRVESLRVPAAALADALAALDPEVRAALEESVRRARLVHADQRRTDVVTTVVPGGTVTERFVPVARVGLYAPGGLAVYPSSVVMNVVPAQEAGVPSLAVASPPQREHGGLPHPTVLAACALLGVEEVYAVGGAQAVAMLALGAREADGTQACPPVDVVTGPGNVYVAAAKRLLRGVVGIDSEAGPTEIAVLADATADPVLVAADLVSQAEHDPMAAAVLVTDDPALADAVDAALWGTGDDSGAGGSGGLVARTRHAQRVRTALTGVQSLVVLVDDVDAGLVVVDAYGAEHLEVQTADAAAVAARVTNAGAIFVGAHSPVSLGDYCAGSNHVLPTGGTSAHASGLSVQTFLRGIHVVEYSREALAGAAAHVVALADAEDLPAHGEAVAARFR